MEFFTQLIKHSKDLKYEDSIDNHDYIHGSLPHVYAYINLIYNLVSNDKNLINMIIDDNNIYHYLKIIAKIALSDEYLYYLLKKNIIGRNYRSDKKNLLNTHLNNERLFNDFLNNWIKKQEDPLDYYASNDAYITQFINLIQLRKLFNMTQN